MTTFDDLESWKRYCEARSTLGRDHGIVGGSWASGTITPPPSLEDPRARVPLERAEELADRAASERDPGRRTELLERACAWLRTPHPRTSPELRRAMRRRLEEMERRLQGPGA